MSEEKCPRCGTDAQPAFSPGFESETWHCGTYREPSGNIYESELCETRQEKRISCEQNEAWAESYAELQAEKEKFEIEAHDLKKQILGMWNYQTRAEKAEAELAKQDQEVVRLEDVLAIKNKRLHQTRDELAKREKALNQAVEVADIDIYNGELRVSGHKADAPELEEWLKNREAKNV